MAEFIKIDPADNVAVAVEPLEAGVVVEVDRERLTIAEAIPAGHKFALRELAAHEEVIKYGYPIGHTVAPVVRGGWVNEKNLKTNLDGALDYTYSPVARRRDKADEMPMFMGYRRRNGEVGIRNELWVIPTVGCVNGTAEAVARLFRQADPEPGVDAIVAWPHSYGCSQLGDDHNNTRRILADMALHPNCGGALIVGLGCENNQVSALRELLQDADPERIRFIETQKIEGDEVQAALTLLGELHRVAREDVRTPTPLSELRVGLKCGGSDGFSGITANPLLGRFSDLLIALGGTSVLTEVPEMFGAETILMNRCRDGATFEATVRMINDFKEYFIRNDQPVYENPSPGNKAGGISTLEEKSLGCTRKCGSATVEDVLAYGDRLRIRGLSLLGAPGNDLVAATALAAAGCQMVLFTTGRGTPFGTMVPTMKISTSSPLARSKPHWIDFDAGTLLDGESWQQCLQRFVALVVEVASGREVNHEKNGFRQIAIFKTGVTL
ncbi:altronate hydrolase [Bacteroidia bacterium]|nr:altronate hydrolase [Bacteroidia bacterium]